MTKARRLGISAVIWMAFTASSLEAAVLEVSYSSLQQMIVRQVMTEGGRYYMEGDLSSKCRFAFIQEPQVDSAGGRLRITALFAGRAALEVGDRCVGPGDNFNLEISGIPAYAEGELFLADLKIEAQDSAYFKIVSPLIERSLREKLRYPLRERLDKAAAWVSSSTGTAGIAMDSIQIESIAVEETSLQLNFDFSLSVK